MRLSWRRWWCLILASATGCNIAVAQVTNCWLAWFVLMGAAYCTCVASIALICWDE